MKLSAHSKYARLQAKNPLFVNELRGDAGATNTLKAAVFLEAEVHLVTLIEHVLCKSETHRQKKQKSLYHLFSFHWKRCYVL